ncbi:MAG TPA: hypothetical protein VKU41_30765 [Polyangiaceae bacterium]|nr:hypothetical protein [Polyangiaceae bacterium]
MWASLGEADVAGATDRRASGGSGGGTDRDVTSGFGGAGAIEPGRGTTDGVARGGAGALVGRGGCARADPDEGAWGGTELPSELPAGPERDVDIGTPYQFYGANRAART